MCARRAGNGTHGNEPGEVFAPLRADKITVVVGGVLEKVTKYRMETHQGKKRRSYYEAHSCAAYAVSIDYLSLKVAPIDPASDDWPDFVMEARRVACDRRYGERLRQLNLRFRRAA
jgi:hypothetical protein